MKKQKVRRLTVNRETIQKLDDDPALRWVEGGDTGASSQCSFVCCPTA